MWDPQMPVLKDYRVVRYDMRGHGDSDTTAGDYSFDMLADDLFGLMDALEIEKTHYIGLSMGGMIGQTAALKDQSRFLSLSLCDTSSRIPPEMRGAWDERIATARANGMESLVQPTMERWFSADFMARKQAVCDKVRDMIRHTPVDGYCGCCRAIQGLDLTDRISAITVPTQLIVGEDDPGTPVAAHEVIHEKIAGSELVVLKNALHFSNVEQAEQFNAAYTGFLGKHR
jgi:3-oxoadipate enol-lactonase